MAGKCGGWTRGTGGPKKRLRYLGEHILGDGPQPVAATVSVVCESFGCLPSEVMDEDWKLIRDILDYRLLMSAKDQHNNDASKMHPSQVALWTEMVEAVESDG